MAASVKTWINDNPPQVDDVDLNGFEQENNILISSSGQTLNVSDHTQTSLGVSNYVAGSDYYTSSGSLNAYILTETNIGFGTFFAPTEYFDGMRIRFLPNFVNTGPATVNVAGLGVVDLLRADGTSVEAGDIPATRVVEGTYNTSGFRLMDIGSQAAAGDITNVVIGGCATTNPWQRQVTLASALTATDYVYLADRIYARKGANTTGQITYRKSTDAPAVSVGNYFSNNSFEFQVTTVQTTFPGADEGFWVGYAVEGFDFTKLAQRSIVVSFVAKSTIAGVYSIALTNAAQNQSVVKQINLTTSYQLFVLTFPASPSLGTWDYANGIGLNLLIGLSPSSYSTITLNTWQASRFQTGPGQANLLGTNGAKFNFDQLFIAPGTAFNGYNEPPVADIMSSCQRYYQKSYDKNVYAGTAAGGGGSRLIHVPATFNTQLLPGIYLPKRLRKAGGIAHFYSSVTGTVERLRNAALASDTTISAINATETYIQCTGTLALTANGNILEGDYIVECELGIV